MPHVAFKITLNIKIEPIIFKFQSKNPPRFESSLPTQVVTECRNGFTWNFLLPEIIDPNLSPVNMTVQYDQAYYTIDMAIHKFTLVQTIDGSSNLTVNFTLTNELNFTGVYPMVIQFECPVFSNDTSFTVDHFRNA